MDIVIVFPNATHGDESGLSSHYWPQRQDCVVNDYVPRGWCGVRHVRGDQCSAPP